jgi:hypothetical protein
MPPTFFPNKFTQEKGMRRLATLLAVCLLALPALAQQKTPADPSKGVHVTHLVGLSHVARNATGDLVLSNGKLQFAGKGAHASGDIAIQSIEDVQTADDSKRLVGGVIGTLSMFGPYGSGRFLSLFRKQIDVLTVEYRDGNGGLHGAIFTMADGDAQVFKDGLVHAGAHVQQLPPMPQQTEEKKQ